MDKGTQMGSNCKILSRKCEIQGENLINHVSSILVV